MQQGDAMSTDRARIAGYCLTAMAISLAVPGHGNSVAPQPPTSTSIVDDRGACSHADGQLAAYDAFRFDIEICLRQCRQEAARCRDWAGGACTAAQDQCVRGCWLTAKHVKHRKRLVDGPVTFCRTSMRC